MGVITPSMQKFNRQGFGWKQEWMHKDKWSPTGIKRILTNDAYTGTLRCGISRTPRMKGKRGRVPNQGNPEIKYFNCSNYKGNRGTCESTHYIRVDFLEQVVLGEIRRLTRFASQHEDEFLKAVMGFSGKAVADRRELKQKELTALRSRDRELDKLFERMYEDNVAGKINDERFAKMSQKYETEQAELAQRMDALQIEFQNEGSQSMTTDMFIATVRCQRR